MKKFLSYTVSFILLAIFLLFLITFVSCYLISSDKNFKLNSDISMLSIGHSQMECALNDSLIPHFQNLAQSGESYFYSYQKLKKILPSNPQIKTVFVSFSNNQIEQELDEWAYSDKYIAYRLPKYASVLNLQDITFLLKHNFKGFFGALPVVFKDNVKVLLHKEKNIPQQLEYGKYLPLFDSKADMITKGQTLLGRQQKGKAISVINLLYLKKIVALCNQQNVKVFLIRTPIHPLWDYLTNEEQYKKILQTDFKDTEFLDFSEFPLKNSELKDLQHINYWGAKKFSSFFNKLLENGLLNSTCKQQMIDSEITDFKTE